MATNGVPNDTPSLDSHTLLELRHHDTHSITPFHVTVIEALSAVIEVDPTERSLELSKYVPISAIDSLIGRPEACDDEHAVVSFFYTENDENLLIVAKCDGTVMVFEGEGGGEENGKLDSKLA